MKLIQNIKWILFLIFITPILIISSIIWYLLGMILTSSTFILSIINYLIILGIYLYIQLNMTNPLFFDWPIFTCFSYLLLINNKNNIISFIIIIICFLYYIIRGILLSSYSIPSELTILLDILITLSCLFPIILFITKEKYWCPTDSILLEKAETKLYDKHLKTQYTISNIAGLGTVHVPCRNKNIKNPRIIVFIHGFGAGNGFWMANLGQLALNFEVYAVEWNGVGRSNRKKFSPKNYEAADEFFVGAIQIWAHTLRLDSFILCGHSMGAMFATSFALQNPHKIEHLILVSPCGVGRPPADYFGKEIPFIFKIVRFFWGLGFTPMSLVRFAGPLGPSMLRFIIKKRISWMPESSILRTGQVHIDDICEYTYHNWAATACGEKALHTHLLPGAFAKRPLCDMLTPEKVSMPITFLYGGGPDWMDSSHGEEVVKKLENKSYAKIKLVPLAGHQVFLDNAEMFNKMVLEAIEECDYVHHTFQGIHSNS